MKSNRIAALLTLAFAASAASATAGVTAHLGGSAGAGAGIGAAGASLSISAPATLGLGAGSFGSNSGTAMQGNLGLGAGANRNGLSATSSANVAGSTTATVRTITNGLVTFTLQNGTAVSVPMTQAQIQSLGLRNGTHLALTRTARGIVMTNVDMVRSLVGRGIVRNVSANSITFANRTGMHTIGLTRDAISRLGLRRGSAIMVSTKNMTQLAVAAASQSKH